jgi:hypothetical protein
MSVNELTPLHYITLFLHTLEKFLYENDLSCSYTTVALVWKRREVTP